MVRNTLGDKRAPFETQLRELWRRCRWSMPEEVDLTWKRAAYEMASFLPTPPSQEVVRKMVTQGYGVSDARISALLKGMKAVGALPSHDEHMWRMVASLCDLMGRPELYDEIKNFDLESIVIGVKEVEGAEALTTSLTHSKEKPCSLPRRDLHPIVGRNFIANALKSRLLTALNCALVYRIGVGKTAIALEIGNDPEVMQKFDGVLLAEMGLEINLETALRNWASALDIQVEEKALLKNDQQWEAAVNDAIGKRRMLLILDDVVGSKLDSARRIMRNVGRNCVYLITTREQRVASQLVGNDEGVTKIEALSEEDGCRVLESLAPQAVAYDRKAALEIVGAVDGLPLALVLIGNYLRYEASHGDEERTRTAFTRMTQAGQRFSLRDDERSFGEIIDLSVKALPSDEYREAFAALSIFRARPYGFSLNEAERLCHITRSTLWGLVDAGLVELHDRKGMYTVHRVIHDYASLKLDPKSRVALHQGAFEYYRDLLVTLEEGYTADTGTPQDPHAYLRWLRYETPEWLAALDNWLHHLSHVGDEAESLMAFLGTYLNAFWWWGCFVEYEFCEQLIEALQQSGLSESGRHLVTLLRRFQENYAIESLTPTDRRQGSWKIVAATLHELMNLAGLDCPIADLKSLERRHVRALFDIFLAEAYRFGDGNFPTAAKWYSEACELFRANSDRWDLAFTSYHLADLNLEFGQYDAGLRHSKEALSLGLAEEDPEVVADSYRVRGDLCIAQGKLEQAVDNYLLAVSHAYRFQVEPCPPDPYTVTFYFRMVRDVIARMEALNDEQRAVALARFKTFWPVEAPIADRDSVELTFNSFPAYFDLELKNLKQDGAAYAIEVEASCASLVEEVSALSLQVSQEA